MGRLVYSAITSLDGYVADTDGRFDWARPDEEVHRFVNAEERSVERYLYGRRMFEVMKVWQTLGPEDPGPAEEYGELWRAADKIIYSGTLDMVDLPRCRLERRFDPEQVRAWKKTTTLSVGGPTLAAAALAAGLVDEVSLYVNPVVVGGGTRALPDHLRLDLTLTRQHRFGNGVVYLAYRVD